MTISKYNLVCVKKNDDKVYRTMGTFNTNDMAILAFLVYINTESISRTYYQFLYCIGLPDPPKSHLSLGKNKV